MISQIRRNGRAWAGLAALAGGLALACGGDEPTPTGSSMAAPAETAAPAVTPGEELVVERVELSPGSPRIGDALDARPVLAGGPRTGVRFEYAWSVDGKRQDADGARLRVAGRRGMPIEVSVVAVAGDRRSAPAVASTRIGNSPPVLQGVRLDPPEGLVAGQSVTATPQAVDPDGDDLEFDYRWDVNGETVLTGEPILPAFHFKRGDRIRLTVSGSDGSDSSNQIQSVPLEVGNARPSIVSTPGALDAFGRFTYKLDVEDADGNKSFTYRLVQGPPGMTMDPVDGTVRWEPRPDQTGQFPVKVEVSDGSGGLTTQSFTMDIRVAGEGGDTPPADAAR